MEVLLPHDFNRNLLTLDPIRYNITQHSGKGPAFSIKINGSIKQYNSNSQSCSNCNSRASSMGGYSCSHDERMPDIAIYTTGNEIKSTASSGPHGPFNFSDQLITITMNKEIFSVFPRANYGVIQNEAFLQNYKLNLIVEYPPMKIIRGKIDENYPLIIKELLEQHNTKYNGEQNYQLIQRQVLLARVFGNMNIEQKEFQELLLVDSISLESGLMDLIKELKLEIYSCEFSNRINLLKSFHARINPNITTPNSLITSFSQNVNKLREMSLLLDNIISHENTIIALRAIIADLEKENSRLKTIADNSSETMREHKIIMDKLIVENNSYKSILLEFSQRSKAVLE